MGELSAEGNAPVFPAFDRNDLRASDRPGAPLMQAYDGRLLCREFRLTQRDVLT